jgi:hypothetical protein
MKSTLLKLPLARGRDVVLARQRARQIARLLGFSADDQTLIAAAAGQMAAEALNPKKTGSLLIQVVGKRLQIRPSNPGRMRLLRDLPERDSAFSIEEVAWMVKRLHRQRFRPLEEFRVQNAELLRALAELAALRASPDPAEEAA